MADKNLLAVLEVGDETHYLIRDFLQSLPDGTKKVFDSFGFTGDLEANLRGHLEENMRRFVIFRLPTVDGLVTEYFSSVPGAALKEIPDTLRVKVDYKQQDTDSYDGARQTMGVDGTIDEMVKEYERLSLEDPRKLLAERLEQSPVFRADVIKKGGLFGFGKTKVSPTYVAVGIETPDGEYLLGTTGANGPYVGPVAK